MVKPAAEYKGVTKEKTSGPVGRRVSHRTEVEERAAWLLENDPEVTTIAEGRAKAREEIEDIRQWEKEVRAGDRDPESGKLTKTGRRRVRSNRRRSRSTPASGRRSGRSSASHRSGSSRSSRSTPRTTRFVRDTARAVARPYGSVASAGWTWMIGSMSLVIFWLLLQREGVEAQKAAVNGVLGGLKRITDPYTPLIPSKGESARPSARRVPLNAAAKRVVRHQPVDPWAQSAARAGRRA